ncbi:DsbE family thiol:disulfide interchange protein [Limibaculum sp. FT325]|uniref:DsbE family thiol:disulfide interchange protein n=1 Tax=Thermohalobaculum sediminis TaxID=2939436 RepID=UPI0020C0B31D|nr:DsbE family thiol:disulfide interchange protein [Limibaculum sediminis]MCL5776458.1 DsbE family thiol:disulfide interchange protein [Limibaculum sediminis]
MTDDANDTPKGGFRLWMIVPALGAASVMAVFLLGLERENPRDLPSTFIDKPAPEFSLPPLYEGQPGFSTADLRTPGAKVVNIWASWCVPCRAEHPMLEQLAAEGVTIHGINYKDDPEKAKAFLDELGNPFALIGADTSGRTGIEWGAYGVPETFVIDGQGRVVYKHIGPIVGADIEKKIRPALAEAASR